jgi:nucleotide-binding universal stress UspA family protein
MSTLAHQQRIVVGVDGSSGAAAAARWAAAEAARRGAGIRLVAAVEWLEGPLVGLPVSEQRGADTLLEMADKSLEEAAVAVSGVAPELRPERQADVGYPVAMLAVESRQAGLLVIGAGGHGRLASLVAGSVAVEVATQSACPVVVVRGEQHGSTAPVVVGVDVSPVGEAAIAFAFEAAAARGVPVIAVHTSGAPPRDVRTVPRWSESIADAERDLAEALAGWCDKYPDVQVRRVVSKGHPARRLLELSEEAQLLVVGSRGHSELVGLVLGSVSHAMVHRAACPVVVVRPART